MDWERRMKICPVDLEMESGWNCLTALIRFQEPSHIPLSFTPAVTNSKKNGKGTGNSWATYFSLEHSRFPFSFSFGSREIECCPKTNSLKVNNSLSLSIRYSLENYSSFNFFPINNMLPIFFISFS